MKSRIFGLENEYGLIFCPDGKIYLPMEKVLGYIFEGIIPNSWPSNAFLVNGARLYQDTGCHPEYATPECDSLLDVVVYDKAGERLLEACLPEAQERLRDEGIAGRIHVFKNNTDTIGNTYGCHENYLLDRTIDFWKLTEQLIPFFVTRQVFAGAGKLLRVSGRPQYFISQRAQHIHEKTSSSTTSARSIINTRDEPHADAEKFRRLHIIVGDSNMSEFVTYLKVGTTTALLSVIEDGHTFRGVELDDPVKAIREISRDPALKKRVRLEDGRELTAVEIQQTYLDQVYDHYGSSHLDTETAAVLEKWESVLRALKEDPMQLSRELDWVSKRELMMAYMAKRGCGLDDPRMAMIDLQYHDVCRDRGLYYLLDRRGEVERITTDQVIERAMAEPPRTTRAKIRGDFIRFAKERNRSYTVDWTYIKLNGYWEETILCMDPFRSSDKRVEELIAASGAGYR